MQKQEAVNVETAVEDEDNDEVVITHPFDPSKVKITTQPYNIGQLVERLEHDEVNMDTEFQRAFVWDKKRQSQFIESIIMRLPIPRFYFDAADNNHWQVMTACSAHPHSEILYWELNRKTAL